MLGFRSEPSNQSREAKNLRVIKYEYEDFKSFLLRQGRRTTTTFSYIWNERRRNARFKYILRAETRLQLQDNSARLL